VVLLVAGGCSGLLEPGPSGSPGPPLPTDRLHVQAHGALERWAAAVRESGGASITFVGDLTSQLGDWESSVAANNKPALASGLVQADEPLSDDTPSRGEVKWLDGTTVSVKVLSAASSLDELVASATGGECPECRPLQVTEARLATGLIETSRGPAEAPVWVFTIAGSAVRVTRVAVDESITITPPPWNAADPPEGISIDAAVGTQTSLELEVVFTGAVEERGEPCGADYTAEAVESELAIVVIVTERRTAGGAGACDLAGRTRTADVALEAPLGNRAVLEIRQGLPVPIVAP
jgi:hypothetical protein